MYVAFRPFGGAEITNNAVGVVPVDEAFLPCAFAYNYERVRGVDETRQVRCVNDKLRADMQRTEQQLVTSAHGVLRVSVTTCIDTDDQRSHR